MFPDGKTKEGFCNHLFWILFERIWLIKYIPVFVVHFGVKVHYTSLFHLHLIKLYYQRGRSVLQEVQEAWWLLLKIQRNYLPLPLWSAASAEQRLLPYPSVAGTNKSGQCEDVLLTINFPPVITRIYVLFILLNYPPLLHMQIHSHRIDLILLLLIKPSSSSSLAVQFLYCRSSRCAAIQCWSLFVVNPNSVRQLPCSVCICKAQEKTWFNDSTTNGGYIYCYHHGWRALLSSNKWTMKLDGWH